MKITRIETFNVALPWRRLHKMAFPSGAIGNYVIVRMHTDEGIEGHATLVAGSWPATVSLEDAAAEAAVPVALVEHVAGTHGLAVGDEVRLPSRIQPDFVVPVIVAGIFRIDDPADPFWWGDPQVLDGRITSDRFDTYGPLFTTPERLRTRAAGPAWGRSSRSPARCRRATGRTAGSACRRAEALRRAPSDSLSCPG